MERIDRPLIDADEQYVWWNSPGITTNMLSQTFHTEICYGWDVREPLILEMAFSVNMNSVPLDDRNYPEGYVCDKCLMHMPYGTVAIAVPTGEHTDDVQLWCIACTRDQEWTEWNTQTWQISLQNVRYALAGAVDSLTGVAYGEGDVIITRPTEDSLTFKLTGMGETGNRGEYAYVNVPVDRLAGFVAALDEYLGAHDLAAVEAAFLDSNLDELERLANGEI